MQTRIITAENLKPGMGLIERTPMADGEKVTISKVDGVATNWSETHGCRMTRYTIESETIRMPHAEHNVYHRPHKFREGDADRRVEVVGHAS